MVTRICASLGLRIKFKTLCYPVYGGRGGYFFKNLKVSKVASSALAEGATFEHFFQKKVAFSAVAEEATFLKNIFLKTKK